MGAEDDATDRGDQQHDRRDLEREQMVGEEQSPHLGRAAEGATDVLRVRKPPARLQPDHDDDLDEERTRSQHRPDGLPARSACPRRLLPRADVRDDEEEHHHHCAAVDEDLRGGNEFRRQQQIQHRKRREVSDQCEG